MHNKDITKVILTIILTAIFLIYLRLFNGISYEKDIKANLGYMDLSSDDFDNDIMVLQGGWELYPYEFKEFLRGGLLKSIKRIKEVKFVNQYTGF